MTAASPPMAYASYYRWLVLNHLFDLTQLPTPLVDVGCDDGGFLAQLPQRPAIGIDRVLPASWRQGAHSYRVAGDATALPLSPASAGSLLAIDVIEHVRDDKGMAKELLRVLAPGGVLLLSTPHKDYRLFPPWVMERAEAAWGHVRRGYSVPDLLGLVPGLQTELVLWPNIWFARLYLAMWSARRLSARVAKSLVDVCFALDRRCPQREGGWLVLRATKT
ncbi:MAG: class I SAM-dependent methyltransferase [Anaerolineae bacterium]|jgi:SAM-dependent methyltransferase